MRIGTLDHGLDGVFFGDYLFYIRYKRRRCFTMMVSGQVKAALKTMPHLAEAIVCNDSNLVKIFRLKEHFF